ncbi:dihydroneopterin aldolase [Lentilactobacillus parafarraginis]|uniref:7,8-dihydroneopterin aldolase n=3 Tax=Lentilactobacillus parafarraginis TaxID=390842 RepID=A0A0R1YGW9_9LACO|nr:dihydroneopterin aldolase [Lentilactobacillus parafarraginis]EHL95871.1 dihydroneopterin aldolase [Lentilactobacillus parafarraginis F0439]KRM41776.1 dihydroneopterin aldolase [Lentilactobacillus parafarraginis DSM 18390 = JCM 14109]TLQ16663.1 dihydroneopterin aldolase [Lentilactobacillus parafarraginis]
MYTIRIKNMAFHSHIGVLPEEKKVGQTVQIDLDVVVNAVPKEDALSSTVSYGNFYPVIKEIIDQSRADLIETLAQQVILAIKNIDDRIQTVTVRVRKLNLPVDGVFDHVEIEMKQ